jgi:RimJ/RimL family protein N-acetyltransferase
MQLETKNLYLHPLDAGDAPALFYYRSDRSVYRFHNWKPTTVNDAVRFIEKSAFGETLRQGHWNQLGIFLKESGELIGDLGIHPFEEKQTEIGFTISPLFQQKGYGVEAVKRVMQYLFRENNFYRIIARTHPENQGSMSLLKKLGFRQEGHFTKSSYIDGVWQDDLLFAILDNEFKES